MKIIVGTSNIFKIKVVKKCLQEIGVKAIVNGKEIDSGISKQPIGIGVINKGARNRAFRAYQYSRVDAGLGLEIGYVKNKEGFFEILCMASVFDGKNYYEAESHKLLLPHFHQELLNDGKFLGEYVRSFSPQPKDKAAKALKNILVYREPFLKVAAENALLLFFAREYYQEEINQKPL